MKAEVIAIGDELTSGQRVDTNSAWISQQLGQIGIRVLHHSTVADDLESCRAVFRSAFDRVDFVICTGGLGPTADDLTRQVIADAMGVPLEQDDASLAHIEEMFTSRGREMPSNNAIQAMFPKGSRVVPNPHGTAPGIDVTVPAKTSAGDGREARCFALPGVPAEMKEMWTATVQPALIAAGAAKRVIVHHELKCFGIGESDCERRLPDLVRRGREPSVGITVSRATITLRITAEGDSVDDCESKIQPTAATIRECLGELVFGEGDVTLYGVLLKELALRKQTLVTAEWATEGVLAQRLSSDEEYGSSCRGSLVGCQGSATRPFSVDATDESSLRAFAAQLREDAQADYSMVIGDWYPTGADDITTDQQLTIALADGVDTLTKQVSRRGHPDIISERTAKVALNLLRTRILDL